MLQCMGQNAACQTVHFKPTLLERYYSRLQDSYEPFLRVESLPPMAESVPPLGPMEILLQCPLLKKRFLNPYTSYH